MFTGLIEAVGIVESVTASDAARRIGIATALGAELRPGDSVAVNGVCLTVVEASAGLVAADIGPETARVTTLGGLNRGARLNLERSMRADARVGGHFVLGHVDAVATIDAIRDDRGGRWIRVEFPRELAAYIVRKGSIAVDGISLTVATLDATTFDVQVVPFTWQHTNLETARPGDRVNLECDMLGKHVVRALEVIAADRAREQSD